MPKLQAKDVIALALIIALIIFKTTGHNGSLDLAVALMVGYYFGSNHNKPSGGV